MNKDQVQEALRALGIEPMGINGEWVQARCPFAATKHPNGTDRSPSFGVKAGARSFYSCFACKSKGALVDLPKELAGSGSFDAEKLGHDFMVAEATGLVVQAETYETFEPLEPLPEQVYGDLFEPVDGAALDYLESRGISMDTADRIGLGDWPEDKRIMFPVRGFDGKLYGWSGRTYDANTRAKVWNLKGMDKSCHIMGAHLFTCDRPSVIIEGNMLWARMHEWGVPEELNMDVGAIMGSNLSFEQADLLAQIGKPVIVFLDGDKAGKIGMWGDEKKGTEGAVQILSRAVRTHYVQYPGKVQDPDDLSRDQLLAMIDAAPVYGRKRVRP